MSSRTTIMAVAMFASCTIHALVPSPAAAAKFRVAVIEFENRAQGSWGNLGTGAADMLATELVKTKNFSVIERERLEAVLNEQAFGQTGAMTPQTAVAVGRLLGVEAVVTGAVTEFGESSGGSHGGGYFNVRKRQYRAAVDIRVIDVSSGEIVVADSASSEDSVSSVSVMGFGGGSDWDESMSGKVMRGAIQKLVASIDKRFKSWTPASAKVLVAHTKGDQVWLNAGAGTLAVGDVLTISRKGEEIIDPATGQVLDVETTLVGEVMVTEVKDKVSIATIRSGGGFVAGDVAEKKGN